MEEFDWKNKNALLEVEKKKKKKSEISHSMTSLWFKKKKIKKNLLSIMILVFLIQKNIGPKNLRPRSTISLSS